MLLADYRVDPSATINFAIRWASECGHIEVVDLLLADSRVDPCANNNCAIKLASRNDHAEVVELLLKDSRADPAAEDNYAIRWASQCGHTEVVELLLKDPRVDPKSLGDYAIKLASRNGHAGVVKLLLKDSRVDPSSDNNYAIRWAAGLGLFGTEVVERLLKDPRVDPIRGRAVDMAARDERIEMVKLLLNFLKYRFNFANFIELLTNPLKESTIRIESELSIGGRVIPREIMGLLISHVVKYQWHIKLFLVQHLTIDLMTQINYLIAAS